jgi:hypothetical protein
MTIISLSKLGGRCRFLLLSLLHDMWSDDDTLDLDTLSYKMSINHSHELWSDDAIDDSLNMHSAPPPQDLKS